MGLINSKKYSIEHRKTKSSKKKTKEPSIRFVLNESSGFDGVVVEFKEIRILDDGGVDGNNCQIEYEIVKVPGGKYQNLDDSQKDAFEGVIKDVFEDMVNNIIRSDLFDGVSTNFTNMDEDKIIKD